MWTSLIRVLLAGALMSSMVVGQDHDPDHGVVFIYPIAGQVYNKMDTINVTYTSPFPTPNLYLWCDSGGRNVLKQAAPGYNATVPITLDFTSATPCWFNLRPGTVAGFGANSRYFDLIDEERESGSRVFGPGGSAPTPTQLSTATSASKGSSSPTKTHVSANTSVMPPAASSTPSDSTAGRGAGVGVVLLAVCGVLAWGWRQRRRGADRVVDGDQEHQQAGSESWNGSEERLVEKPKPTVLAQPVDSRRDAHRYKAKPKFIAELSSHHHTPPEIGSSQILDPRHPLGVRSWMWDRRDVVSIPSPSTPTRGRRYPYAPAGNREERHLSMWTSYSMVPTMQFGLVDGCSLTERASHDAASLPGPPLVAHVRTGALGPIGGAMIQVYREYLKMGPCTRPPRSPPPLYEPKNALATDFTWNRGKRLAATGSRALPRATGEYAAAKFPIIGWLPRYRPRWLINDVVAGLTVGLMLIPQGLSYARIATVPAQYGLLSSWLPSVIYALMGTTKDLSTGPTSLISLLTAEIIESLREEGEWTAPQIASAVATMMGIYGLAIGLLKLGFLLEFISLPVLSGFISAVAITIILNQMDSLLGEPNVGDGTATQIHDIFQQLPQANGYACAVGFTGIFLLTALDQAGKRWGKRNKLVWFLAMTRAFIALVIFTGIGYAVNKPRGNPDNFLFDITQVEFNEQDMRTPQVPSARLLSRVAGRSVAVFIGSAVEHTAIARSFGVRNNYMTDQSQELTFYGVTNIVNSFFHAIGVGGAMSRTAVNSACNVKSPLSGVVTTAVVLVCIFELTGALYWVPKATLAAIIITACWPLISPPSVFYRYWKTSLADFVSSMIAFWVSLFVSTEIGIASSVGFNIVYVLLRQVFARVSTIPDPRSELAIALDGANNTPPSVPEDTRVFQFTDSVFFPNAYRAKTSIIETLKTHHAPAINSAESPEAERGWSVTREKRLAKLRRPCTHLESLVAEIRAYGGSGVLVRFSGMSQYVQQRFERAGWEIISGDETRDGLEEDRVVRSYRNVVCAANAPRQTESTTRTESEEEEKARGLIVASHVE
ncbi:sulfate transporter family-domain-containing protein [Chaetomium sp. MPI-CAGE-AT-0009]|nr:sulfate transporter family-domain-containing protein [Chaetomium sp. MPI-CAGE-AT-0009]